MTHRIALALLLLAGAVSCAVARRDPLPRPEPDTLDERPPRELLLAHVSTLAADEMEGRRQGTPGHDKARDYISAQFAALGLQPATLGEAAPPLDPARPLVRPFVWRPTDAPPSDPGVAGENIVAIVPGTETPEEYLLVTAHYDHLGIREGVVYNGADDNASGVAAILGVAAQVAQRPARHTVVFVAFDQEERGLRGSEVFVAQRWLPHDKIIAVLNLDMVGRSDIPILYAVGSRLSPALQGPIERVARRAPIDLGIAHDRRLLERGRWGAGRNWLYLSDQGSFLIAKIPALYLGIEDHDDYHRPTDDAARIDGAFLQGASIVALGLLRELDTLSAAKARAGMGR